MTIRSAGTSPRTYGRVGGLLYLFIFAAAPLAEFFIRGRLIVHADAADAKLFELAALAVLGNADYLKAFDPQQLQTLSYLSLKLHGDGYDVSLIFFGWACILLGYLIYKSEYLPRALGALLAAGGLGYQISTFTDIVAPVFAARLYPWVLLPAFVGELGLCLWLIVKGVDVPKWETRARAQYADA